MPRPSRDNHKYHRLNIQMILSRIAALAALLISVGLLPAAAQENYEIQVYGSETVAPGNTMVELHSNFTATGSKTLIDGMAPTNHAWHETIEITHGFN